MGAAGGEGLVAGPGVGEVRVGVGAPVQPAGAGAEQQGRRQQSGRPQGPARRPRPAAAGGGVRTVLARRGVGLPGVAPARPARRSAVLRTALGAAARAALLSAAVLRSAVLQGALLRGAAFRGTALRRVVLRGTAFRRAGLQDALL
ncbi:pentapeptide repeat-containing protein [Streptomyces albus]|uniref:pentapeptide repeat-containing protein n=1 Tax=Streptomyces albus TaxID=1888 RepID=UPI0034026A0C